MAKGTEDKLFFKGTAFASFPEPNIKLESTDCGATGSWLAKEYAAETGIGKIPSFKWTAPAEVAAKTKEYLLICEDPDAPRPEPFLHGVLPGIPASKTTVEPKDLEIEDESKALLKGGFYYGQTIPKTPYYGPRPPNGHGPHRYFFFVVALNEPLDKKLLESKASLEQIRSAVSGKVLGWGLWQGLYERK